MEAKQMVFSLNGSEWLGGISGALLQEGGRSFFKERHPGAEPYEPHEPWRGAWVAWVASCGPTDSVCSGEWVPNGGLLETGSAARPCLTFGLKGGRVCFHLTCDSLGGLA